MVPIPLARFSLVSESAYSTRPGRAAQCPPQLVHHRQVGAAGGEVLLGQGRGGVDHRVPVRPGAQHRGGEQVVTCRADPADVHADRGCVQVDRPGGLPVEHARQAAGAQQVEGEDQVRYPVPEPGRGIGAGSGAEGVGALLDDRQHVGDGGLGRGEPVIEQVDGAAEDDFLGVGDGCSADERAQGHQQGQAAGADLPPQRLRVGAAHLPQRCAQRAGVERVDPVHAAADADHLAAEMLDQHAVVRLGVPEDQDPGAGGDGSGELPFDQGGFADAGLAEDELAGVGDQARRAARPAGPGTPPRRTAGAVRPGCRWPGCRSRR